MLVDTVGHKLWSRSWTFFSHIAHPIHQHIWSFLTLEISLDSDRFSTLLSLLLWCKPPPLLGYCNNLLWSTYSLVFYTAVSSHASKKSDHVNPLQMPCCLSISPRVKYLNPRVPVWSGSGLFDLVSSRALPHLLHFSCSLPWTPGHWHLLTLSENGLPAAILLLALSLAFPLGFCLTTPFFLRLFLVPSIK